MPQSARPARTAWAISAPVGQTGRPNASASSAKPARATSPSKSTCARPLRPQRKPRALGGDAGNVAELQWIARRDHESLLAAGNCNHDRVVKARRTGDGVAVGNLVIAVEPVQVNGGRGDLAAREPPQAGLAALRQTGKPRVALAPRPFQ